VHVTADVLGDAAQNQDWALLLGRGATAQETKLRAVTFFRKWSTASAPVEIAANDGRRYVVKALRNDAQIGQSIFNDHVAGFLGAALGAPIPEVALIEVPAELVNINPEMCQMVPGTAHASVRLPNVSERIDHIDHVNEVLNRPRFAALAVFGGWLLANDRQFLYQTTAPNLVYSVDHGHFFPAGPNWTIASLQGAPPAVIAPDIVATCGLTNDDIDPIMVKLEAVSAEQVAQIVAKPPAVWGVQDGARVALASYVWRRRTDLLRTFRVEE
jgi:hypothetical protein